MMHSVQYELEEGRISCYYKPYQSSKYLETAILEPLLVSVGFDTNYNLSVRPVSPSLLMK